MENQLNGSSTTKKLTPSAVANKAAQAKDLSDVKAVAENLFENADEIAGQLKEKAQEVEAKVKEYGATAASYVKRNPGLFAVIATAIAVFFVSQIFSSRSSARK